MHCPSGAIIDPWENPIAWSGVRMAFTPPAKARSHEPARSDSTASLTATREEEQAASSATLMPVRFSA
ncbi:hypothetical protein Ppa06_62610 [Planomonospora parontospora subsp. parontospora]|uniref:Uncharacterized protein n=2 Tax=Planomonospora parontospora TaxID=58119 RepID=A0AA37BCA2_9ACTN|nr:hypothetical protein GCM10010126_06250 [Planomonospora parontospora]GII12463.1 hypothetical protein Ppa06_62610 [Planomonospora parontospora subsp. parontospora]